MEECTQAEDMDYRQIRSGQEDIKGKILYKRYPFNICNIADITASSVAVESSLDSLFDGDFNNKFINSDSETYSSPWVLLEYHFEAS